MGRWLVKSAWLFAAPIVACFVLAFLVDYAFAFVSLMLLFLVFPTALMMVYFNYAMKPEARAATSRRVVILSGGQIIGRHQPETTDDDESDETPKTVAQIADTVVDVKSIRSYGIRKRQLVFTTGSGADELLIIPLEAFDNDARKAKAFVDAVAKAYAAAHGLKKNI